MRFEVLAAVKISMFVFWVLDSKIWRLRRGGKTA
jgi:hypothetical protein